MEQYKNKEVLITGGLGFIGSNLAQKLVEFGSKVTIIDSLLPDSGGNEFNIDNIKSNLTILTGDIRDKELIKITIPGKDYIFNLAGMLSHIDSMRDPYTDLEINCTAQIGILETCRKLNSSVKIVYTGTRGQYGAAQKTPVSEDQPLAPLDTNGINKTAGEMYHILYSKAYGLNACSLRLTNTFGPRHQMRHPRQGIVNWFIRQIIDGETVKIFGNGSQIRDINYIDDVVNALLLAMISENTTGNIYNIGGTALSLTDLVKTMIAVNDSGDFEIVPSPEENNLIEVGDFVSDYSKFTKATGWKPQTDIAEGLKITFKYYKDFIKSYW